VNSGQTECPVRPVPFPQIASGDLDIAVGGQLAATNLPLGDQFEPGPMKMISFEASFRRGGLRKQYLEDAPGNSHRGLIFTQADAEHAERVRDRFTGRA
jgi:hypothetical protein